MKNFFDWLRWKFTSDHAIILGRARKLCIEMPHEEWEEFSRYVSRWRSIKKSIKRTRP